MDFSKTSQEELFLQMIREFAEKEVKPLAAEIDKQERLPIETVQKMSKLGIMGIPIPKEYGGSGSTVQIYTIAVEELSRVCTTTGVIVSTHTSLCCDSIMSFGMEEQKQHYLPKLASGEWIGAFGLTEPNADTDASAQQTFAVEKEECYILNGNKVSITNAEYAHVYIILAMADKNKGNKGISTLIVEKDNPGFSVGRRELKLGIRGSATCEPIMENCRIPKDRLLGKVGGGFKVVMHTLDGGRIDIAAQALGIARGAMDETVKYTKEREQFGRSITKFQNTQFQLVDLKARIDCASPLVRRTAWCKDNGLSYNLKAAEAKLLCAETAMDVTTKAVQFHGDYGYTREHPVEHIMRDAKIIEIYEGTSEVQRMVIAAHLLK